LGAVLPRSDADREAASDDQKYEDALTWLHRIFVPSDSSALPAPHRFCRTRPLFDAGGAGAIQNIPALLDPPDSAVARNERTLLTRSATGRSIHSTRT
jgi:hypothetical protein